MNRRRNPLDSTRFTANTKIIGGRNNRPYSVGLKPVPPIIRDTKTSHVMKPQAPLPIPDYRYSTSCMIIGKTLTKAGAIANNANMLSSTNGTAFTLSMWFNFNGDPIDSYMIARYSVEKGHDLTLRFIPESFPGNQQFIIGLNNSQETITLGSGESHPIIDTSDVWHHIVISAEASDSNVNIMLSSENSSVSYWNEDVPILIKTYSRNRPSAGDPPFTKIGCHITEGMASNFRGKIDDIAFWNRALNQVEAYILKTQTRDNPLGFNQEYMNDVDQIYRMGESANLTNIPKSKPGEASPLDDDALIPYNGNTFNFVSRD